MNTVIIKDKSELLQYKQQILTLFSDAYGQELSETLWDWAYIENPFGNPYVALAFDDGLVAHYAVIPYPLSDNTGLQYKSFLSMTTMVAQTHRKYGLFTKLATAVYEELKRDGADWVMGFPNQSSAPGFRKRLGWEILDPDCVVSIGQTELAKIFHLESSKDVDSCSRIFANLSDKKLREWRLSKPGAKYVWQDGLAYKKYNGQIDIIYYQSPDSLKNLPTASVYNLLVPRNLIKDNDTVTFEYMFGGLSLNSHFIPDTVHRQMCLSDVF